jgi:hypothetical protein
VRNGEIKSKTILQLIEEDGIMDNKELQSALQSEAGRKRIAQLTYEPFRKGRDWLGLKGKILYVDKVEPGVPMRYHTDATYSATTMSRHGTAPKNIVTDTWVEPIAYPIACYVRIPVIDIATANFNMVDRQQVKAQSEMAKQEDSDLVSVLHTAATGTGSVNAVVTGYTTLSRDPLAKAFSEVEDWEAPVMNVLVPTPSYKDIRLYTDSDFDRETQRELLKTGLMGTLWGADVRRLPTFVLQNKRILVCADSEFLGVWSVRVDCDSADANGFSTGDLEYGWIYFEYVCPTVMQNSGVAEIQLT